MKGLLLAGGHGTRLRPLTNTGNKHMLPIANKPMLLYGLEHLKAAGIRDVAVILGPIKEGVVEALGDGSKMNMRISYLDQPEPKGLAHAVQLSQEYMKDEPFVMYLGDNLLKQGIADFASTFHKNKLDCLVGVCPVDDPSRFGIAEMDGDKLVRLVEKPKEPKSNLALIGVYVFGSAIFDAVKRIRPSWRNELEITDAIQFLLFNGGKVEARKVSGWWKDTGKPEDLLDANHLVLLDMETKMEGTLSEQTALGMHVNVGNGTKTLGIVRINGPALIGNNCEIGPDVYIGPYTTIGDNCILRGTEIENSIVMQGSRIESSGRIIDSLIGSNSTLLNGNGSLPKGHKLILGESSFARF